MSHTQDETPADLKLKAELDEVHALMRTADLSMARTMEVLRVWATTESHGGRESNP